MAYKDKTVIRAAAMQRDRDDGMNVSDIAKKYNVSEVSVYTYTCSNKPLLNSTEKGKRYSQSDFAQRWNRARYMILLGLRPAWPDEWNTVRHQILGEIKKAKGL